MRAFPTDEYYDEKKIGQHEGMTLRDFFAAHAISGLLAPNLSWNEDDIPLRAGKAYEYADAMIKARHMRKARAKD